MTAAGEISLPVPQVVGTANSGLHLVGEGDGAGAEEVHLRGLATHGRGDGDALGGVDGAAASDADDEVSAGVLHRLHATIDLGDGGVRGDVVVYGVGDARLIERGKDGVENAGGADAGVGDDEGVLVAGGLGALAEFGDAAVSEDGLDGERKRWHGELLRAIGYVTKKSPQAGSVRRSLLIGVELRAIAALVTAGLKAV